MIINLKIMRNYTNKSQQQISIKLILTQNF